MNKVFSGIKYDIKKINQKCKSSNECKGFPDCETLILKLMMMMILIKLNLLAMIIYQ